MSIHIYNGETAILDAINDVTKETALKLKKEGIKEIVIAAEAYAYGQKEGFWQRSPYDIDTFIAVRDKLDELIDGIDTTMPEKKRFAEIYKRICNNITYDYNAGYPKTKTGKKYARNNLFTSRDLTNGLLEGKCVCSGYADILRTALNLVGIEAVNIEGPVKREAKKREKIIIKGYEKLSEKLILKKLLKKHVEKLKNKLSSYHAWVKVKIDDNWYNADPTWDVNNIRQGLLPTFALQTDEECKNDGKLYNLGPKCTTIFSQKEKKELFRNNYIELFKNKIKRSVKRTTNTFNALKTNCSTSIKKVGKVINKALGKNQLLLPENKQEKKYEKTWDTEKWEYIKVDMSKYYTTSKSKDAKKDKKQNSEKDKER